MIEFDISKIEIKNVYLKFISRSNGGTMRILDTVKSTDNEEVFKQVSVPTHVVNMFKATYMTKYLKPVLTSVCYYDGLIVALQPHPLGNLGKEKIKTLFGDKYWESNIHTNVHKTLSEQTAFGKWFVDGALVYRFEGKEPPKNLSKDGKFQSLTVKSFRLTDLAHQAITPVTRMSIAFIAGNGQNVVSPPVWRSLDTVGASKMNDDDKDDAVVLGMNEHAFDKVDRMLAVNLNFALHASKVLIENFGYDSIEPLRLDDLMVALKTVNLPKIDKSIKNTHDIGLKFTHAMAWVIGLGARANTLESTIALRTMLRYLTTRGIVHKTALAKDSVFQKDMDMKSVPLLSIEQIQKEKLERQKELFGEPVVEEEPNFDDMTTIMEEPREMNFASAV
jgi:hypothetical protein